MDNESRLSHITLRLPKDLHVQLREAASASSHSMNAEIISRLESTFDDLRGRHANAVIPAPGETEDVLELLTNIRDMVTDIKSELSSASDETADAALARAADKLYERAENHPPTLKRIREIEKSLEKPTDTMPPDAT